MPKKSTFSDEQYEHLWEAAKRVRKKKFKSQEEMGQSLGLTQQSIANLLKGTYKPSVKYAKEIAILDGRSLEDIVGEPEPGTGYYDYANSTAQFKNLETCISFHDEEKPWSSWTVAAARAGFFGSDDMAPKDWEKKLTALETILSKARGATR